MQWTNDRNYQNEAQADVYSDVKTPYSATFFASEQGQEQAQEFSLEEIQKKLGVFTPEQTEENVSARSDAKPSNQTLNMSYDRDYSSEHSAVKSRLGTKTKIAIAGYCAGILILVIAVTLCGVSVTNLFGSATALYSENVAESAVVADLTAQVAAEENYAVLAEKAAELGYIDASRSNTQTYTEIETRPAQNFNVESNWFDSLCDWLSGAFGG